MEDGTAVRKLAGKALLWGGTFPCAARHRNWYGTIHYAINALRKAKKVAVKPTQSVKSSFAFQELKDEIGI